MRAHAQLAVAARRDGRGAISRLRSDGPFRLRPTFPRTMPRVGQDLIGSDAIWVSRAAGAAGPLGGDDLRLEIDVGAGATLVLHDVSASLALPGAHGDPSRSEVVVRVGAGATFVWMPQPLIAGGNCCHSAFTSIELAADARALVREELWLGRHGELPGTIRQRLRVTVDGAPIYDQEIAAGPEAPGWDGAAVTGGRRAIGVILLMDPASKRSPEAAPTLHPEQSDSAVMKLAGCGLAIGAVAGDGLALRQRLDAYLRISA